MKVHELLATPDKWVQKTYAMNKDGIDVWGDDPEAVCWCMRGAVQRCYPGQVNEICNRISDRVRNEITWNDAPERTHAEVLALCKELDI